MPGLDLAIHASAAGLRCDAEAASATPENLQQRWAEQRSAFGRFA